MSEHPDSDRVRKTSEEVTAYWRDAMPQAAADARRARDVAPTLVGKTRAAAQQLVENAGLHIRFHAPSELVTADFGFDRITACADEDVIISAEAG